MMNVATLKEMNNSRRTGNGHDKMGMGFFEESFSTPAARLSFLIGDKGVKQKDVAEMLEISAPYLSTIVSGEKKNLPPESWLKLAEYFGVTLDWLLCRQGAPMYWPVDVPEGAAGISKQADEAARILDDMPPRKRDEMLGVLRAMSFHVQVSELDAEATTKRLRDSLAAAGIILSPKVTDAIRGVLFAFAMGLGPDRD